MIKAIRKNKLRILTAVVFFVAFFLFFFLRNHYYVPIDLEMTGNFPSKSIVNLRWDSGKGFNKDEVVPINFESQADKKTVELPQLGLRKIEIVQTDGEKVHFDKLNLVYSGKTENLDFVDANGNISANLNPKNYQKIKVLLLAIQILLSLLMGWLAYEVLNLKSRFKQQNLKQLLKFIFILEKRWFFWLLFLVSCGVFSFWLLGQWPGAGSPDSFYQLFQTKSLVLEDAHPYLHTLYMLTLMQFYDSFGTIAIFQILVTAGLGSYIFFFCFKNGLRWYLIMPFFLAFIFSIPIGLFNIVIWKDIPFSILVAFWGFYLFYLGYNKSKGSDVDFSYKKIFVLSFLFILMTLIRHNGPLYLVVVPLILIVGKLMPSKVLVKFVLTSVFLFVTFNYLIPYAFNITKWSSKITSIAWKVNPMANVYLSKGYITDDPVYDREVIGKIMDIDQMQNEYNPNYGGNLVLGTHFDTLQDEDIKRFNHLFYIRMLENFPTFVAERTHLFVALLSCRTVTWTNEYYFDTYKSYIYLWRSGTALYMRYTPVKSLSDFQLKIIGALERVKPIVFDLIFPTLIFLIIFFLYKWLPISARSSFLIISQLPVWMVFVIAPDFRYLYSIYLYYLFAFPLLLLEIFHNKEKNRISIINKRLWFNLLMTALIIIFCIPYLIGGLISFVLLRTYVSQMF